ncbi:SPOR domain-containing protein [Corynebacterium amycolatum]|uniref:SPOR domain-containing protein n=1 Tax=Corynebacterium amycolatum TaxID=43765 RepID=A0AB37GB01_CORAY|nr:SPOR domain-containing protein [Corynebacterium amycolatum]QPR30741.1 SPOR domain-containing protein [Corynebacterium amycolatum]QQB82571.1 SPOR domain-containing protein [Corynebacterium amycolatum]QQV00183.1 SPOR domain-containing protein [Corynebacterium amycolatum]
MSDNSSKWYYQPSTGTVFQGKKTGWDDRMGPYDSEEEARAAMEKVAERNKAADDWDEEGDDWGVAEK